jgi:asparagine synthase (glutamine-hydrolysing)
MCGICGVWSVNGEPVSPDLVEKMNRRMLHRGPDQEGRLIGSGLSLAMRRLSIIDLDSGRQPVHNEDDTVWVVFNGEIYNYQSLRTELMNKGHNFYTRSDTEVIVHAYEQWGLQMLSRFNGMFAIALWDVKAEELYIVRDRLGKKPLYYCQAGNLLAFASEIKSLLEIPSLVPQLHRQALALHLMLGYLPAPHSLFQGINKLPTGNYMRLQRDRQPEIVQYWDVFDKKEFQAESSSGSYEEQFLELFSDSVRLRMSADVPIGIFLSGGLDSSSVMAMIRRNGHTNLKSFTVSFIEEDINEASYARTAAVAFGTDHHELLVRDCTPELFQNVVWHSDEPLTDPALIPTYLLSKLAAEYVKVVLTGEGPMSYLQGTFITLCSKKTSGWTACLAGCAQPCLDKARVQSTLYWDVTATTHARFGLGGCPAMCASLPGAQFLHRLSWINSLNLRQAACSIPKRHWPRSLHGRPRQFG